MPPFRRVLLLLAVIWTLVSTLRVFPFHLTYFNELAASTSGGGLYHLVHSNLDWGQGLLELESELSRHPEWGPVGILYSGPVHPTSFGCRVRPLDVSRLSSELAQFTHLAVSVNILAGEGKGFPWYKRSESEIPAEDLESFLRTQQPVSKLDGSIFLFDMDPMVAFLRTRVSADGVRVTTDRESQDVRFARGILPISAKNLVPKSMPALLHGLIADRS
jgi:hypothetical protein